jgi:cellulose synthase/poly-beta-1,6-N-acetylglucosamine synthase-like glycosyltransferase
MSWVIVLYLCVLAIFFVGAFFYPSFIASAKTPQVPVSIVICARNEEQTIIACLESILKQDYPKQLIELLVVDDASTDATFTLAEHTLSASQLRYTIIRNETPLGKKRSLAKAIAASTESLIITRDADTYSVSEHWLSSLAAFHTQEGVDVIIGPIAIEHHRGFLSTLQNLENRILRMISAGSVYYSLPFLNSGANFAFTRAAYNQVGGYGSHLHIASGDDVFFLQEAAKLKSLKIGFLNSVKALVYTYPATTFANLLQQRARWAGKVLKRPTIVALTCGLLIIAANLIFLGALIALFFHPQLQVIQIVIFKAGMDIFLLFLAGLGFEKRPSLFQVLSMVLVYPLYLLASSVAAIFIKSRWK